MIEKFCVIDTETGGLDDEKHSLLSFALVPVFVDMDLPKDKVAIGEPFSGKVRHEVYSVTAKALEINKLQLPDVYEQGRDPMELYGLLAEWWIKTFQGETVGCIGHNPNFDLRFFNRCFWMAPGKFFSHRVIDTSTMGSFLYLTGQVGHDIRKSDNLFKQYPMPEFKPEHRHTALGDALQTAHAFKMMIEHMMSLRVV